MTASTEIDPVLFDEAASWLVTLQSGQASEQDWQELVRWRERSPAHAEVWQRAEQMLATFSQLPPPLGRAVLARLERPKRRQALRLGLLALAIPAGFLAWRQTPWQSWTADLCTAVGEQKTDMLSDGTRLLLNTDTAVNLRYGADERRLILLSGEILVETGKGAGQEARPFRVETAHGMLLALGTRFSVRHFSGNTRVAVFEGAVQIRPHASAGAVILHAGEQITFSASALQAVQAAAADSILWQRGMLLARGMPLGEVVAELARYQHGVLRCAPEAASLAVWGAFPLADTGAALALLEKTMPVRVMRVTPYWTSVQAR